MQRRLSETTVDDLVSAYLAGSPIDALAAKLGVSRTTIICHLDRRAIERRKVVRKMADRSGHGSHGSGTRPRAVRGE